MEITAAPRKLVSETYRVIEVFARSRHVLTRHNFVLTRIVMAPNTT